MKSNPIVSVIMVCHNHERYIGEAIESTLSQTFCDIELIIVDDGSSDSTLEIIQQYKDPRLEVIEQRNSGPSIALNAGLEISRGEFIAFASGDDLSLPNRLTNQVRLIDTEKADLIFCLPQIIGPNSEKLDDECLWFFHNKFDTPAELYRHFFYFGNFLCAPSGFCRRTAIEKIGHFRRGLVQLQDFDYWIRACKNKLTIKLFEDQLIQYRYLFGENLSDKRNINRVRVEQLDIYRRFLDDAPVDLLRDAFGNDITANADENYIDLEIDKSLLYLDHPEPSIKLIGAERIIRQLENDEFYKRLVNGRDFMLTDLFQLEKSIDVESLIFVSKLGRGFSLLRDSLRRGRRFGLSAVPKWIKRYL